MARPSRPAIDKTLILGSDRPASVSGMVLVTTTCSRCDREMRSIAGPDSTGCEAHANTLDAPALTSASAVFTSVPAVSMMSSRIRHVRPLTSPMTCMTSATFMSVRRLSTIPSAASTFLAKNRPPSTRAAHVFQHLDVNLAIREPCHRGLASLHAQERTNFFGQRLIGRAAEDLELIVLTPCGLRCRLRLVLEFFLWCRCRRHVIPTRWKLVCRNGLL